MNCETNDCRKEKRGCKGCYYNKSADEMFEELGYTKEITSEEIIYTHLDIITFDLEDRELYADGWISPKTIKAINKKVEELGWKID